MLTARGPSRLGAEHWLRPMREHHPEATGHHAAALVIGRRIRSALLAGVSAETPGAIAWDVSAETSAGQARVLLADLIDWRRGGAPHDQVAAQIRRGSRPALGHAPGSFGNNDCAQPVRTGPSADPQGLTWEQPGEAGTARCESAGGYSAGDGGCGRDSLWPVGRPWSLGCRRAYRAVTRLGTPWVGRSVMWLVRAGSPGGAANWKSRTSAAGAGPARSPAATIQVRPALRRVSCQLVQQCASSLRPSPSAVRDG